CRFTMPIRRGCLSCCEGSVFEDSRPVATLRRMMDDPCQQRFGPAIEQSFQYKTVQALATRNSKRIFYREARKLVSKRNSLSFVSQHARADAFFEGSQVRADRVFE